MMFPPCVAQRQPRQARRRENLFRLLETYQIEALRTPSAATKSLDHIDGWQKVYADEIATIHLRKPLAPHPVPPAVESNPH